jgi:hypothetical protein
VWIVDGSCGDGGIWTYEKGEDYKAYPWYTDCGSKLCETRLSRFVRFLIGIIMASRIRVYVLIAWVYLLLQITLQALLSHVHRSLDFRFFLA